MTFETEKTALLFFRNRIKEIQRVIPVMGFSMFINRKANKVILYFDEEIKDFPHDVTDFVFDITNDPLADPKFPITNLGYYNIRITASRFKSYRFKNKTMCEIPIKYFEIHFNLPLYLPIVDNDNFREKLNYRDEDLFLIKLEFNKNNNYNIDIQVFRENILNKYNINLLKIDNNYKKFKSEKIKIINLLKRYVLI